MNDGGVSPSVEGEKTAYLLPTNERDYDGSQTIEQCYEGLFECALANWYLIEDDWPDNRTFDLFQKWFSVEWHSVVLDLCGDPLKDEGL